MRHAYTRPGVKGGVVEERCSYLLGARGQLDAGDAGVGVVRHHDGVVTRAAGQGAAVARFLQHTRTNSTACPRYI